MDEMDKILLQHLPDTGLCARSQKKQEERRRKLKVAILMFLWASASRPIPPAFRTKEGQPFPSGGVINGPQMAMIGGGEGPELIIDELQFNEQDKFNIPIPMPDLEVKQEGDKLIVTAKSTYAPFIEHGTK